MAPEDRRSTRTLNRLLRQGPEYNFFQAVRLLQTHALGALREDGSAAPEPVGSAFSPDREVVRFLSHVAFSFPSSEVASIEECDSDAEFKALRQFELKTTFMGLVGANGVLPQHYTARVLSRKDREQGRILGAFLDVFHHRIISLFYKAWLRNRLPFRWEQARLTDHSDSHELFTQSILSLNGFSSFQRVDRQASDSRQSSAPTELLTWYSGIFQQRPRNAVSLSRLIAEFFGVSVEVRQFQGQWVHLSKADQTSMPTGNQRLGRNCQLGLSAMAGSKVWDVQSGLRIQLGPVSIADFDRLRPSLPGQGDFQTLRTLVRLFAGPEVDIDVNIVLKAEDVPGASAGRQGTTQLGRNSWCINRTPKVDATDGVFLIQS